VVSGGSFCWGTWISLVATSGHDKSEDERSSGLPAFEPACHTASRLKGSLMGMLQLVDGDELLWGSAEGLDRPGMRQ
jgi:hypothetical protein